MELGLTHPMLRRAGATTAIWSIQYMDPLRKAESNMLIDIVSCGANLMSNLHFYFEERDSEDPEEQGWWGLFVDLRATSTEIMKFEFRVEPVDSFSGPLDVINDGSSVQQVFPFRSGTFGPYRIMLKNKFVKAAILGTGAKAEACWGKVGTWLKLTVTPIFLQDPNPKEAGLDPAVVPKSLAVAMKDMFVAGDNFADLKLETKDKKILNVHRNILAARSRAFANLIERKGKEKGFSGIIKLDMTAEPLLVILRWIYTGELVDDWKKHVEEVLDGAVKLELIGLLHDLSHSLRMVCNKDNMFQLYWIARKSGLSAGSYDVADFIRQNI